MCVCCNVICGLAGWYCFSTPHKRHDFRKKIIELKMCVLIWSATLVCNFSHSKKNRASYKNVYWPSCKVPVILVRFSWNSVFSTDFWKYSYQFSRAKLFHADGHDKANSPFSLKIVFTKHRTDQFGCQYRNAAAELSFQLLTCGTIGVLKCLMCQIVNAFNGNISWPRV
jgi:hypothetical protein